MQRRARVLSVLSAALFGGVLWLGLSSRPAEAQMPGQPGMPPMPWSQQIANIMPVFGEGNWIVVAETAFPVLAKTTIETFPVRDSLPNAVNMIEGILQSTDRLRGVYHISTELDFVPAVGIDEAKPYLDSLKQILPATATVRQPHEKIMDRLLEVADRARILVIKTDSAIPYGTVAIELKRGFWSDEQEAQLREAMKAAGR